MNVSYWGGHHVIMLRNNAKDKVLSTFIKWNEHLAITNKEKEKWLNNDVRMYVCDGNSSVDVTKWSQTSSRYCLSCMDLQVNSE